MAKILHIACENYAGVPYSLVRAERMLGLNSEIITLYETRHSISDCKSLNLPFASGFLPELLRRFTGSTDIFGNTRYKGAERPPVWNPERGNFFFFIRDALWRKILVRKNVEKMLDDFDILVLDGGVGLLRSGELVLNWYNRKGKLVSIFYGDDLRRRGVMRKIDEISKFVFTFEFDHTLIHPRAKFLFYPFFADEMPERKIIDDGKIRIGHSPTRRASKGTDAILEVLKKIADRHKNVEIVLIEGMTYKEALIKKSELDIFIDQIGELGYGISGLEALAMGIPTIVEIQPDFERFLGKHPFVNADRNFLEKAVEKLIADKNLRDEIGEFGKNWVKEVHNPIKAAEVIFEHYKKAGWL